MYMYTMFAQGPRSGSI